MKILSFNIPETGIVAYNTVEVFRLIILGSEKLRVTIDLINESGNPDVFVRRCKAVNACTITK